MKNLSLLVALASLAAVDAKRWALSESLTGNNLINAFNFETGAGWDNGGVVNYLPYANATARRMINISSAGAVTFKTPLGRTTKFRDSIRVNSKKIYNLDATTTGLLFVFDVQHAPVAYGAWPALWMVGEAGGGSYAWPKNGEIDIIETVHASTVNTLSVHTDAGCTMQTTGFNSDFALPLPLAQTCDVVPTQNQGCGVRSRNRASIGAPFNAGGGGVYAAMLDASGIRIYFFPRNKIPTDLKAGAPTGGTPWGTPDFFIRSSTASTSCPMSHFTNLHMVINTNWCGSWAGGVWNQDLSYVGQAGSPAKNTGYATCEDYVKTGLGLTEAYWTINSIKIYK